MLYVDQEESVRRQMARAKMAALHNLRAKDAGTEDLVRQLRTTDVDEAKCRSRYAVFKEHYGTLLRLKQVNAAEPPPPPPPRRRLPAVHRSPWHCPRTRACTHTLTEHGL